jgi:hypothetical protein
VPQENTSRTGNADSRRVLARFPWSQLLLAYVMVGVGGPAAVATVVTCRLLQYDSELIVWLPVLVFGSLVTLQHHRLLHQLLTHPRTTLSVATLGHVTSAVGILIGRRLF